MKYHYYRTVPESPAWPRVQAQSEFPWSTATNPADNNKWPIAAGEKFDRAVMRKVKLRRSGRLATAAGGN